MIVLLGASLNFTNPVSAIGKEYWDGYSAGITDGYEASQSWWPSGPKEQGEHSEEYRDGYQLGYIDAGGNKSILTKLWNWLFVLLK